MKMFRERAYILVSSLILLSAGCNTKFLDPGQIGRFRPVPAVNVILDTLGVAEETPSTWEKSEDPKPIDSMVYEKDYTFGPGDVVRISVFELFEPGILFEKDYVVTETGKISIPQVGVVDAMGLTEAQLEDEIKTSLSPHILKDPSVTVTLINSQQRIFSILGNGVPRPGRYPIPRYDYRLMDAIADGQVATQYNVSYIFVTRQITGKEQVEGPAIEEPNKTQELKIPNEQEMMEIIAPHASSNQWKRPNRAMVITSAEMATEKELSDVALPMGLEIPGNKEQQAAVSSIKNTDKDANVSQIGSQLPGREPTEKSGQGDAGRIEWIFKEGKWVPVEVGGPGFETEVVEKKGKVEESSKKGKLLTEKVPENFDWEQTGTGGIQTRVIKIPTDKLSGGDPRYNIVIKPGDSIQVPLDMYGEFCIMGNVNFQGFIPLTGREMTLKMAVAAAGGLGPLAWPKRCEVTRRIGKKKEEIVMIDLDKIASGEQPDFFIKNLDLINVGTHPTSRFRAVLRDAFRATYGFGFIYDRNFADRDFGTGRPFDIFD